jgi:hypothetical protein
MSLGVIVKVEPQYGGDSVGSSKGSAITPFDNVIITKKVICTEVTFYDRTKDHKTWLDD